MYYWLRLAAASLRYRRLRNSLTLGALVLGVAALIFLTSLMVGISDAMIDNSVRLHTGHSLVTCPRERALAMLAQWRSRAVPPGVRAALPRLQVPAVISDLADRSAVAVRVYGVLPEREVQGMLLPACLMAGHYLSPGGVASTSPPIYLGSKAAETLKVAEGDTVRLYFSRDNTRRAMICGIFRTGIEQFDRGVVHMRVDDVLACKARQGNAELALLYPRDADFAALDRTIAAGLDPGVHLKPWRLLLPELRQLVDLNRAAMLIVIVLVVAIMASGTANTSMVSVIDRYRTLGVMRAMGVSRREIFSLVVLEAALLTATAGLVGGALGMGAADVFAVKGIDLSAWVSHNRHFVGSGVVFPRFAGYLCYLPPLAVLLSGVVAALLPAWYATRQEPAVLLRQ